MSRELEDEFGKMIIHSRNAGIRTVKMMLAGEMGKNPMEVQKRVKDFLDSLTSEQQKKFLASLPWILDSSFFSLMVFLTQGKASLNVKLEAGFKEEKELLSNSFDPNDSEIWLEDLYFDWVSKWGELYQ